MQETVNKNLGIHFEYVNYIPCTKNGKYKFFNSKITN